MRLTNIKIRMEKDKLKEDADKLELDDNDGICFIYLYRILKENNTEKRLLKVQQRALEIVKNIDHPKKYLIIIFMDIIYFQK